MPCGRNERTFLSNVEGKGVGPLAYEKANAQYNKAVRKAASPTGQNWRNAKRWAKDYECPPECPEKGTMVIGPYITSPGIDVATAPNRVRIYGEAGCLAIVFCRKGVQG